MTDMISCRTVPGTDTYCQLSPEPTAQQFFSRQIYAGKQQPQISEKELAEFFRRQI